MILNDENVLPLVSNAIDELLRNDRNKCVNHVCMKLCWIAWNIFYGIEHSNKGTKIYANADTLVEGIVDIDYNTQTILK